jgi:hypothetical protein
MHKFRNFDLPLSPARDVQIALNLKSLEPTKTLSVE